MTVAPLTPQVHPVPLAAVGVRPAGTVSTTLTAPMVGGPPTLVALMVYAAPTCPWVKVPT